MDRDVEVEVIPVGLVEVDEILGIGGIPKGRITEVYGRRSSGRTTLVMRIAASAQQRGLKVAWIDADLRFRPDRAEALGVDLGRLLMCQPEDGESALHEAEKLARSRVVDLLIVDSVAGLIPRDFAAHNIASRLLSQRVRKITSVIQRGPAVLFVGEVRREIHADQSIGGNALKFYASVRIEVRRQTTVKIVKNKLAPPFRSCEINLIPPESDRESDVCTMCQSDDHGEDPSDQINPKTGICGMCERKEAALAHWPDPRDSEGSDA